MKKIIISALILIFTVFALSSCAETKVSKSGKRLIILDTIDNIADYTVIRGENSSEAEQAAASDIRSTISEAIGSQIAIKTDWNTQANYEILIGNTSRRESISAAEGLRYDDYVIKFDGRKIIIVGGSDEALTKACEFFKNNFISDNIIKAPAEEGFKSLGDYVKNSVEINGKDILELSVFYNGKILSFEDGILKDFMKKLRDSVGNGSFEKDKMRSGKNYIVINNTGLIADEYYIEVKDGNLYLNGSYDTIDDAINYLTNDIICSGKDVSLDNGYKSEVMSVGKKEIYSKAKLYEVLENVYNDPDKCIIGQQVDHEMSMPSDAIAEFVTGTGEEPGILGLDLGVYGLFLLHYMETEPEKVSQAVCEIVDYASRGGIITLSSHWSNPTKLDDYVKGNIGTFETNDEFEAAYRELYTDGSETNTVLMKQIAIEADFLAALKDNGVPAIWRPLHEMNGNWFWFCTASEQHRVSADVFVDFWKYIYNYYTVERGLDNLLWCYAPNTSSVAPTEPGGTLYYYPGDQYVDIVGVDWYTKGAREIKDSDNYLDLVNTTGKMGAMTEFGPAGSVKAPSAELQPEYYSTEKLMSELMKLRDEGYSFAYLLTWTAGSQATIGVMGGEHGGFEFMQDDYTLGLADVAALLGK